MAFTAKKWQSFIALIPAVALSFLDQTILPVALPAIQKDLGASSTELQWCIDAYLLAITLFVLVCGKLSDRMGHKNALFYGISGFAAASVLCGMSTNIEMLIAARALQGFSAAFMFPAQTALIAQIFPQGQRGKATGLIVSMGSLFMIMGPLIGGYLTEVASWHWLFWINLPIAAIGLGLIASFLPISGRGKGKVDFQGFLYFTIGVSLLTLVLMQATDWGWASRKTLIVGIASLIALFLLVRREKSAPHPFLDLTLFKHPVFSAINISVAITQFILMITVFRTIYFQEVLDYSPFQTGLIMFVSSFPVLLMAPLAGFLSDKFSPKLPIALGYLALIYSFFYLAFFSTPSLPGLMIALVAFGIGIPFIFTPSYSSAIASVPQQKTGVAMGMILTLRMLGGAVGLALIHSLVSFVEKKELPQMGEKNAAISGFSAAHFALAFLLIIAFAITFVLHRRKSSHQPPEAPAEGWD